MDFRRLRQVCRYGWKDAAAINAEEGVKRGRTGIFLDMLGCYFKYNVWTNQYKKERIYALEGDQRREVCLKYKEKNTKRDKWVKVFFDNYKFLNKWSSFKYERSASLQEKRCNAYRKRYGLGEDCFVGYGVILHRHHYKNSKIEVGKKCGLSERVDIDYTGGLVMGDFAWLSEGSKVLTHNHVLELGQGSDDSKGCVLTPLTIGDRVWIGSRAIIMPGVVEIGRGAMISSDSYVNKRIPPYAIVMGNPAKIVGFRMTPDDILNYEKGTYSEEQRLPEELLRKNYEKYFLSRWKQIKEWNKI